MPSKQDEYDIKTMRGTLNNVINSVQKVHKTIQNHYHLVTYCLWCSDEKFLSWGKIVWKRKEHARLNTATIQDNERGRVRHGRFYADIQAPDTPGDGTVPYCSANHQLFDSKRTLVHGSCGADGGEGYEHAMCCGEEQVKKGVELFIKEIVESYAP